MRSDLVVVWLCACISACASVSLWPAPSSVQLGGQVFPVSSSFKFTTTNYGASFLQPSFVRYQQYISQLSASTQSLDNSLNSLVVQVLTAGEVIQLGVDESYSLVITTQSGQPSATLKSSTVFGALRGLETFYQLLESNSGPGLTVPSVSIVDAPRFPWRGLLIDSSRHFLPLHTIMDVLTSMSFSKMNVLHWHIVDGQSFPYESSTFPLLSGKGAYSPTQIYTQANVAAVIAYANSLGIRVVPEFDVPAHATSWGMGYPWLVPPCNQSQYIHSSCPPHDYSDGCKDTPIDPSNEQTYTFLDSFFGEIASVFPDAFIHMGGDEVPYACWDRPDVKAFMQQHGYTNLQQVEAYFIGRMQLIGQKYNKTIVNWQEVFVNSYDKLSTSTVIDVWMDQATLESVVASGRRGLLSYGWYLDHLDQTWENFYLLEPFSGGMSKKEESLILGGEASMWGEQVDETNIQQRVWIRAAAAAERLWSSINMRNTTEAFPRLIDHRCRLVRRGVPASPFAPGPDCY